MLQNDAPMIRPRAPKKAGHRALRVLAVLALGLLLASALLFYGTQRVSWLGPLVADKLRVVFGDAAVSRLEELAYHVEDHVNRVARRGEKPQARWAAPKKTEANVSARFPPADVGPFDREHAAPGDGVWVPVAVPNHAEDPPVFYKTLLHPDPRRSWSELYVVAIDLERAQIVAVAGTEEPKSELADAAGYARTGLVPKSQDSALLAAFNGGFKAEHGHYGMRVDGVTLLGPRPDACTVAAYEDGALRIGTWSALAADHTAWWRQGPQCLVEGGQLHPGLTDEANITWGAALGGATVVRRSAIGLDPSRRTLYVGLGNATTARVLALGMQHAGATDVAELDINWSYPRFVLFRRTPKGTRQGYGLFEGFVFDKDEYTNRPATRDFFYIVRNTMRGAR
jgi:hypothetical protein